MNRWAITAGLLAVVVTAVSLLCVFTWVPQPWLDAPRFDLRWLAGALLGGGARFFAFRIYRRARIAIDSPIYISVAFQLNVLSAAWLVAAVLAIDGMVRVSWRISRGQIFGASLSRVVLERLYIACAPALVLVLLGVVFRLDQLARPLELRTLLLVVPTFSLSFLSLHYFSAGGLHWFDESNSRELLRGYFFRVIAVELALIPLSFALIVTFTEHGLGLFVLIGTIAIFFSAVYRRAVTTSAALDERLHELSVLNSVGRLLSRTLDRHTLLEALARESCRLVGASSQFILAVPLAGGRAMHCEIYNSAGVLDRSVDVPIDYGLVGYVFAGNRSLRLDDLRGEYANYADETRDLDRRFNSWLGVPVTIYDEVIGVIAVESEEYRAYDDDHVRVMSTIADQAAIALENTRLYELATIDGLTRLFVRRYFDRRLEEEMSRAARYSAEFSVGVLDLDRFKRINDTHGHPVGDQVLRAVASAVQRNMRSADLAGRYGGEEFALIFPRTGPKAAAQVAERIRADVEALRIQSDQEAVRVTVSIGIASYPESGASSASELVALADRALYRAKEKGRNRVELASREPARAIGSG